MLLNIKSFIFIFFNERFIKVFIAILIMISGNIFSISQNQAIPLSNQGSLSLPTDKDYLIGENDTLEIKINDAPELSGIFQINSQGVLTIPTIGKIEAKNKTLEEITEYLTTRLKGNYLINPIVTIRLSHSNQRSYFIQGEVKRPGVYQVDGIVTLLKILTIAGGLNEDYGNTINIFREISNKDNGKENYEVFKIDIHQLLNGDLSKNIEIKAGDMVQIPSAEFFYVAGRVSKPGQLPLREKTTLRQAISLAGGLDEKAGQLVFLLREKKKSDVGSTFDENEDNLEVIEINLTDIMQSKSENDYILQPRDFLQISEAGTFYVVGEVNAPGAFIIPKDGATLRQAISMAKGTKYEGDLKNSFLYRLNSKGERDVIEINIPDIMKGEKTDPILQSSDILIIPNSRSRTVGKALLNTFTNQLPLAVIRRF